MDMKNPVELYIDDKIYFSPHHAYFIGILDIHTRKFSTISLGEHMIENEKFSGSVIVDRKVYFSPRFADSVY